MGCCGDSEEKTEVQEIGKDGEEKKGGKSYVSLSV